MLSEKDGTPQAIKALIEGQLFPMAEQATAGRWHLAIERQNPNGAPGLAPPSATHHHFYVEICFCLAGHAEIWTESCVRELAEGDILVIAPAVEHCTAFLHAVTIPREKAFSRLVWMAPFPYGCLFNLCETASGMHRSTARQLLIESHANTSLQEMMLELKTRATHSRSMAKWKLLEALTWLCRVEDLQWTDRPCEPDEATADTPVEENSVSGRAKRFIEQHFDADLNLETLARVVCTNKSHLCRVFKMDTSVTVVEYLTRIRVEASRKLLLTSVPVSAVSKLVGFDDPYYFSRVFRKMTGLSPSDYRGRQRQEAALHGH